MNPSTGELPAFGAHDHASCRARALDAAAERCRARRLRLTPARACALDALLESHRAMTAYELLDRLREAGHGGQPPVAYRALGFLVENGFAHRIERLGAYVACTGADEAHPAAFMVCRACRAVAETALDLEPGLAERAAAVGFAPERTVVEVEGLCARCAAAAA